jgi:hypothetical protein
VPFPVVIFFSVAFLQEDISFQRQREHEEKNDSGDTIHIDKGGLDTSTSLLKLY